MAGTATQAPEKTAPKDAAPKGDTQKDGGAPAPTTPATDGQGDGSGLTLADLPHLAVAAPGATPDGAAHYLTDEAKTAEAWLAPGENGQDAGFIRSAASPDRAIRVDDVQSWAQIVDSMGLRETDPNADPQGETDAEAPAADGGKDDKPADASSAKAPAPKAPETGKKELSGGDDEGKVFGRFKEEQHPRDRLGRFVHAGDLVAVGGHPGGPKFYNGRIVGTGKKKGTVEVEDRNGRVESVRTTDLVTQQRAGNSDFGTGVNLYGVNTHQILEGDEVTFRDADVPGDKPTFRTGRVVEFQTGHSETLLRVDPGGEHQIVSVRPADVSKHAPKDVNDLYRTAAEYEDAVRRNGYASINVGRSKPREVEKYERDTRRRGYGLRKKAAAAGQVVTPDDHEEQTGIMVALIVPEGDAADIMLTDFPTALPASELHLTLAYLGKTEEVDDEGAYYANVLEALRDVAAQHDTLNGVVSGVGRFTIPGDADAFYYSFDAPELPDLRHDLVAALEESGINVNREHGFTPHITLAYLKEGEESPIRRAESKVLAFENLTFCYGDQRLNIRLGGPDPEEADAEFEVEAGRPGQLDSTAPSAMPDGKAKPNPFAKGGKKGGPPIATGAWVAWGDQRGRVDLVVTNGKVPGVEQDVTGSKDKPAARVVVYEQGAGGKWKSTGRKVGVSASSLKRSFPLGGGGAFGKKDLDFTDPQAALVDVLTGYYETLLADGDVKESAAVDPAAVWTVYERGIQSWPGEHTEVPNEAWGLGRAKAFLTVAAGGDVPGYVADRDLLPEGHPLAVKAAPAFVIDTPAVVIDEAEGNTTTGGAEVVVVTDEAPEQESKVAAQVAQGEHLLDATVINDTLAALRALLG
jgi:2'-5' RNA ligase